MLLICTPTEESTFQDGLISVAAKYSAFRKCKLLVRIINDYNWGEIATKTACGNQEWAMQSV